MIFPVLVSIILYVVAQVCITIIEFLWVKTIVWKVWNIYDIGTAYDNCDQKNEVTWFGCNVFSFSLQLVW